MVCHHLRNLGVNYTDVLTSILLTSFTSLEKMYDDILSKTVVTTERLWDSLRLKVLPPSLSPSFTLLTNYICNSLKNSRNL